jgi:hypothetical protein
MDAKKYPLEIHIDSGVIKEGRDVAGMRHNLGPIDKVINSMLDFVQYPYTNEDSEELSKAFKVKGPDGRPFIRDKKSMLFIVGGGAIIGSMEHIFENNPINMLVGIDLNSAQLCNFKYLARRGASEEAKGKYYFLRRSPNSSNTSANAINVTYEKQEIDEKIFGYPITIEPENVAMRYFLVPAKGTYPSRHSVELVKGDIVRYLKEVEESKAPDLIYTSNLSEWSGGKTYNAILDIIRSEDKFALGTTIVGTHLSKTHIAIKVLKDGKQEIETYQIRNRRID